MRLSEILDDEDDAFLHKSVDKQRRRDNFFYEFMHELHELTEKEAQKVIKIFQEHGTTIDGEPLNADEHELPIYWEAGEKTSKGSPPEAFIEVSMRKISNYRGAPESTLRAIQDMAIQDVLRDIAERFAPDAIAFEIDGKYQPFKERGFYDVPGTGNQPGKGFFDVNIILDWDKILK